MTARIEGTTIYLTRGDTFAATVEIKNADGSAYEVQNGDVIKFALKSAKMRASNTEFADVQPLILKTIPNATLRLEIAPNDTKKLPFAAYKYDIEITKAGGVVDTFINNCDFFVMPEVLT